MGFEITRFEGKFGVDEKENSRKVDNFTNDLIYFFS